MSSMPRSPYTCLCLWRVVKVSSAQSGSIKCGVADEPFPSPPYSMQLAPAMHIFQLAAPFLAIRIHNQLRCGGHRGLALGRYSYQVSQPRRWRPDKPLDAAQEHRRKAKIAGYCDHHPE
ncbi:hypothetical protein CIHG_07634 [Coccidioides immitis H538.4]|uniref:Uncharacterized protein n=1 Tax=Coccidioides immitis H538.4 TaxID=396776 RepID=A0A0J8RZD6_COCIT|nr:hypothetical protein CIHG_07634 [Coccidioides immitis H538.4]